MTDRPTRMSYKTQIRVLLWLNINSSRRSATKWCGSDSFKGIHWNKSLLSLKEISKIADVEVHPVTSQEPSEPRPNMSVRSTLQNLATTPTSLLSFCSF